MTEGLFKFWATLHAAIAHCPCCWCLLVLAELLPNGCRTLTVARCNVTFADNPRFGPRWDRSRGMVLLGAVLCLV